MAIRKRGKVHTEFSLSAMTDIIFFLLIFFILASTISQEQVLKLLLPKGIKSDEQVVLPIRLQINADMEYFIDGEKVLYTDLPSRLAGALKQKPGSSVSVWGDKSVQYERVMELVRMANEQDAKVVLALERASEPAR